MVVFIVIIAMLTFMLFHNVTHYTSPLLSHLHVNTTCLLNTTRALLVATSMILGRLECTQLVLETPRC